jgi:hypothetical protein
MSGYLDASGKPVGTRVHQAGRQVPANQETEPGRRISTGYGHRNGDLDTRLQGSRETGFVGLRNQNLNPRITGFQVHQVTGFQVHPGHRQKLISRLEKSLSPSRVTALSRPELDAPMRPLPAADSRCHGAGHALEGRIFGPVTTSSCRSPGDLSAGRAPPLTRKNLADQTYGRDLFNQKPLYRASI